MNIKIQGGGAGRYANVGSCAPIISYLQHEDIERAIVGEKTEPFFNDSHDKISSKEITYRIDKNKSQLGKNDSKFFVITVSPSAQELKTMGKTPQERAVAMREYIRNDIIKEYAANFNKNLTQKDVMYYSKIHHNRGNKEGENMHVHIIVSRKDMSNSIKISPQTNHKNTMKGTVKGGFNRKEFILKCETSFDKRFSYDRPIDQTFEHCNTLKNGSIMDIKQGVRLSVAREQQQIKTRNKSRNQNKGMEL